MSASASDKVTSRYSIQDYVAQVAAFLDHLGIDRVPIVGHGLGSVVGVCVAQAHADRVDQVMAVSLPLSGSQIGRALGAFSGAEPCEDDSGTPTEVI